MDHSIKISPEKGAAMGIRIVFERYMDPAQLHLEFDLLLKQSQSVLAGETTASEY